MQDDAEASHKNLIMAKFFEIRQEVDGRQNVYLFGKRIAHLKTNMRFQLNDVYRRIGLLENMVEVTQMPKARGWLRELQLANLIILREIDRLCTKWGINYWLSEGTLLGAVRHGGYIPWDDDIDIGMTREDLEVLLKRFPDEARKDLYVELHAEKSHNLFKVKHKELPHCFVDIFVFDYYHSRVDSLEEKLALTRKIHAWQKRRPLKNVEQRLQRYREWTHELMQGQKANPAAHPALFRGLEYQAASLPSIFYDYEDIFPTQRIDFEGMQASIPANADMFLTLCFKNYMDLPPNFFLRHTNVKSLPLQEILRIKALLKQEGICHHSTEK